MLRGKPIAATMLYLTASLLCACSHPDSSAGKSAGAKHDDDKILNFYASMCVAHGSSQICRLAAAVGPRIVPVGGGDSIDAKTGADDSSFQLGRGRASLVVPDGHLAGGQ